MHKDKSNGKLITNDRPIEHIRQDSLNIEGYVQSVSKAIDVCEMPFVVSIEGEWGSGKTSFMKLLEERLCSNEDKDKYKAKWIDAWELLFMTDKTAAANFLLAKILYEIGEDFSEIEKEKTKSKIKTVFQGFLKANKATSEMGVAGIVDALESDVSSAAKLRDLISSLLEEKISKPGNDWTNKGYMVFIDNLDRLDPGIAVKLIEMLYNIFSIKHCVFILAIDKDVVSRGIREIYPNIEEEDREKFEQDFFDKVVQLPLELPIFQYDIVGLLQSLPQTRVVFGDGIGQESGTLTLLDAVIKQTVGNNPRAIKRVMNLMQIRDDVMCSNAKSIPEEHHIKMKLLLFVLTAVQMKYGSIYKSIAKSGSIDEASFMAAASDKNRSKIIELLRIVEENIKGDAEDSWRLIETHVLDTLKNTSTDLDTWGGYSASNQIQQVQADNLISYMKNLIGEKYEWPSDEVSVLDFGMGDGKVTEEKLINGFLNVFIGDRKYKVLGVDINKDQVEVAKRRFDGNENVTIQLTEKEEIAMNDEYDLIFSNAVLHWVIDRENPVSQFKKFLKHIKPGGWFAIQQGGADAYRGLHEKTREAARLVLGKKYDEVFGEWAPQLYYPSAEELKNELERAGFEVEEYSVIDDIMEKDDSVEIDKFIDNFANASFAAYEERLKEKKYGENVLKDIKENYKKLCEKDGESLDRYNHRIYAVVKRPL